jgi:hypothetical protein
MKKSLFSLFVFLLLFTIIGNAQVQYSDIRRDSFSLKYPSDWKIDTDDEDYDPDNLFSIDSPDDNMVMFMIFNVSVDRDELLESQVEAFTSQLIKKPEITEFSNWGNYEGKGKILKGKLLGVFKGFVKIFVYTDQHKSMIVVEQCFDKNYETLKKSYELISSSFRFR